MIYQENELIEIMSSFEKDPLGFVMFAFPWGKGELANFAGPEEWQAKVLADIRDGLLSAEQVVQESVSSGHGIGKSAIVSWLTLWSMTTFEDTRGIVTANTETQLRTKTWPELAKWYNLFIAKHWFCLTATSLYSVHKGHEKTWRIDAIPWSEHRTESFAGMHNKGKRIIVIMDEASAIPDIIWEVTEGALTDQNTQIMWLCFGNPTRNTGRFFSCFHRLKHRWKNYQVDSRSVSLTNKKQIQQWIDDYGVDSDFVKVRVRGEFPSSSDLQFIPSEYIEKARGKHLREDQFNFAPKIIGVDGAWSGECAIYLRQGNMAKKLAVLRDVKDDFIIAGHVARFEDEEHADAVFVDLGYGTGIVSAGKQLGRKWIMVAFGGASLDQGYLNKRAEMWKNMRDWLKGGAAIEDDPVLCEELGSPQHYVKNLGPNTGKIFLESKEDMKSRGLDSPNRADALALTFAHPVLSHREKKFYNSFSLKKYNPFKVNFQEDQPKYNPFIDRKMG